MGPAVRQITFQARNQARQTIPRHDADSTDRGRKFLLSKKAALLTSYAFSGQ
jgi:hypothetical protein